MRHSALLLLFGLATAACDRDASSASGADLPLAAFDTASLRIVTGTDTLQLRIELAQGRQQQAVALMERSSLPEDAGMLFLYAEPQPDSSAFWMFRTRIPLDIAFVDSSGIIRHIQAMEPFASPYPQWCSRYPAGVEFWAALETNRGYFARHGIQPGDRLLIEEVSAPDEEA